ncbi:MAG: dihydroorotate dehydrogenase electron transfer subunit [Candidatus Methylomirabilales bacterium]
MHAEVDSLRRLHADYYLQRFTSPRLIFEPGQFIMVKPSGSLDPFLPRAYSILRVQRPGRPAGGGKTMVEILYKVIGKGTTALSQLKRGDRVDFLGPLGNGYRVPQSLTTALLVAGGIGVPPVVALAESLRRSRFTDFGELSRAVHGSRKGKSGHRSSVNSHRKIVAFVGGKTRHGVLCVADLRKAGATVHVATEDGSLGHRGLVTDLLDSFLRSSDNGQRSTIYACGPHPMLHAVTRIAERFEIPCQVSLEAEMGCGFGACMGCVIPVHGSGFRVQGTEQTMNHEPSTMNERSYKLCCKDGPVFDAQEIAW